jgi:DNA polymerase-4
MAPERDIFHVDVDAFFASVEQLLDPALRGKAVIVGGDPGERSVVSSASYEARKWGVRSAMPVSQALRLCPEAVRVRGDYRRYVEYSGRIRRVLDRFAPLVEVASLDDFYMDFTGCRRAHGPPMTAAERLRGAVLAEVGLHVSVGIAGGRTVAKIASDLAKPRGVMEVWRGREEAFLRGLPVERLPGVGPSTAESLRRYNITAIGDIARLPRDMMERSFGAGGLALWESARGIDDSPVQPACGAPKSISRETTFARDTSDRAELRAALYSLTEHAARQLREEGLRARRVTVKARYADFTSATACRSLPEPAEEDALFFEAAVERLEYLMGRRRLQIRLVGVALGGLVPGGGRQAGLFEEAGGRRRTRFYQGLDKLRDKFGFDIARVGPGAPPPKEGK